MKIYILILFVFCIILGTSYAKQEQKTEIDSAAQILNELENEAQKDIDALDQSWGDKLKLLTSVVSSWETQENAQANTCNDKLSFKNGIETAVATNQHYISWISDKIAEDLARLEKLTKDRCDHQKNYINGLKHDKVMLNLIDFLIAAIEKYNPNQSNFLEKSAIANDIAAFINFYQTENYNELVQLHSKLENKMKASKKKQDSETGHIDENANRENVSVDSFESGNRVDWPKYKIEVLELLNNLKQFLIKKIAQNQEDEVNAGIATAEFKLQLEKELQDLDRGLYQETSKTAALEKKLIIAQNDYDVCAKDLDVLQGSLGKSKEEVSTQEGYYKAQRASKEDELKTFQEVKKIYSDTVHSQGEDLKARVDDYAKDQTFDNQDYNARKVDDIASAQ